MKKIWIGLRDWRRSVKAKLPYVRRREYLKQTRVLNELQENFNNLLDQSFCPSKFANQAAILELYRRAESKKDLCLFVTHAVSGKIKEHVVRHVESFAGCGFDICLIVNTDLHFDDIFVDDRLRECCFCVCVRDNLGFDFGAWSHVSSKYKFSKKFERIVLVNDSILGPLNESNFKFMIDRVRSSRADVVGLTENLSPKYHLQSYFLSFQGKAISGGLFDRLMLTVYNFPTKQLIIDAYEVRLTERVLACGAKCEAVFKTLSESKTEMTNDTHYRWRELIDIGFPYIKIGLLKENLSNSDVRSCIPSNIFESWECEQ